MPSIFPARALSPCACSKTRKMVILSISASAVVEREAASEPSEQPASGGAAEGSDAASLSTTALAEMERMTILRVFEQAHGDKALAGKMLGISRATLYRKLKRYNIGLRGDEKEEEMGAAAGEM